MSQNYRDIFRVRLQRVSFAVKEIVSKSYEYIPPRLQKVIFPYTNNRIGLRRLRKSFIYKALLEQGTFIVDNIEIKVTKDGFMLFKEITITSLYKELK